MWPGCSREGSTLIKHLANIRTSGTILASSPYLIALLLRGIDFHRARTIVQLGIGTGCITRALLRRMRPDARLIAVEVNPVFVQECRRISDRRLLLRHDCAGSLDGIMAEIGVSEIDCIVSSLPLAIMDDDLVERVLAVTHASLRPDGTFLQYQYSLKHRRALEQRYPQVRLGFTLRNFPPAFVYSCSRVAARSA